MSKVSREPAGGCCTYAARVRRTNSDSKTPHSPVISFLLFKNERLLNKPLTASLMGQTDKSPAHVLQKSYNRNVNSCWIHIRPHAGRSPPPRSTLSFSRSLPPLHPSIPASSSLQEQIRLHTSFLSMSVRGPWSSALLTSLPPAPERKEERKEEILAPPSPHSQAACASAPSSSSSSSFSLNAVRTGMAEDRRGR